MTLPTVCGSNCWWFGYGLSEQIWGSPKSNGSLMFPIETTILIIYIYFDFEVSHGITLFVSFLDKHGQIDRQRDREICGLFSWVCMFFHGHRWEQVGGFQENHVVQSPKIRTFTIWIRTWFVFLARDFNAMKSWMTVYFIIGGNPQMFLLKWFCRGDSPHNDRNILVGELVYMIYPRTTLW